MTLTRLDMHAHSNYSPDSVISPETMVKRYIQAGIRAVCVTDHDTIEGALHLQRMAPFKVVIGEEVTTAQGHLLGLFLRQAVAPGMSALETVEAIHEQGGLAVIPHPFDRFRSTRLDTRTSELLAPIVDAVEVFNSRTLLIGDDERTASWARLRNLPMGAGSDCHTPGEVGTAYVDLPDFNGAGDFVAALRQGVVVGRRSNPLLRLQTSFTRLRKRRQPGDAALAEVETTA
jgi:predicted metal-dependent phosphoesterase TrpH